MLGPRACLGLSSVTMDRVGGVAEAGPAMSPRPLDPLPPDLAPGALRGWGGHGDRQGAFGESLGRGQISALVPFVPSEACHWDLLLGASSAPLWPQAMTRKMQV